MKRTIIVDFDGTITKKDTCVAVAGKFSTRDWEELNKEWAKGNMSTRISSERIFQLMDFNENSLRNFLETIEIDEYFLEFIKLCREKEYDIYVVSDGFDFNIEVVFGKYGIKDLKVYSNVFFFGNDGKFKLEFPNESQSCKKCGTCKTEIYNKLKESSDEIVYIGDGYSDKCVAAKADILFAKSYLARHCDKEGIEYKKYDTFKDVIKYLKDI